MVQRERPLKPPLLLIFSQTFVPDPAAVGRHMADVAMEMARRGYRVRVYTSARGYDDPSVRYRKRELIPAGEGDDSFVDVRRLPFSSFGKKSILTRALGTFTFMVQVLFRGLFTRGVEGIFFSTSPPLIGVIGCFVGMIRRKPTAYWAMDLNPDQLIAMGKISPTGAAARFLEAVNRWILRRTSLVVALDRFMAERLKQRGDLEGKLLILPPWPHEDHLDPISAGENPFIAKHDLAGKFVVMYSGNHSPANPLGTLLEAALALKDEPHLRFLFVGGGVGKKAVVEFAETNNLTNVLCLPYQRLEELKYSLTAADVHVVSLGEQMVGIIHPCKIYGAMAAGKPILYLGPRPSHIADIMDRHEIGWHVDHGDVGGAGQMLRRIQGLPAMKLVEMGERARVVLARELSHSLLRGQFCDRLATALKFN